jgi:hypothetical protein
MEGVLDCEDYLFHHERGYGDIYTTDEEYRNATTKLSSKEGRAMRNRLRQSTKTLTAEEIKLLAENKKKQQVTDRLSFLSLLTFSLSLSVSLSLCLCLSLSLSSKLLLNEKRKPMLKQKHKD